MQTKANRILSMLLALVMVFTLLPATVLADGETESVFAGWSLTLGDNIGVNFYLAEEAANYTVNTTVAGSAAAHTAATKDGYYVVTVKVAAAQMTDTIGLTVLNGETEVHSGSYTVRQYAETILTGEHDDYVKQLVKAMLNYGAAAQTYFAYNTDPLANAGYEIETGATVPTEVPEITVEDNLAGIGLYGMSLVFRSKTAVRFYFTVGGNIADYTFKVGETAYEPVEKDGKYYVEISDINPQDLDKDITVSVNDGAMTVTYSPLNYIVRKYNNAESSDNLKALVQAMYGYHLEAKYYNSVVVAGALQSSGNGWTTNGIYATMPENDAYFVQDDWSIEYTPVSADVIKLVRGGVTTSVGMPGQGTLIKFTANDYYLKTENHTISGEVLPLVDQDYLIVEGRFQHPATGSVMYISKTYIYNNNGTLEFTTTEPVLPVSYDVGVLQSSAHGAGSSGIYFTTAETNDAPYGDWNTYYDSNSVDNIKLIRDGETISVGLTDRNTICKFGENDYYLRLENWTIGDYAPFTTDDMFIVEGAFTHKDSKTTLNIEKTYIYYNGSSWVLADSLPTVYEAGVLQTHESGMSGNGIYVRTAANEAPSNSDWSLEYKQTSADNIKVVRNGETISIGIAGRPLLIKLNECDYYLKLENWTIGQYGLDGTSPITTDDMLIIEGDFFYEAENVTLNIEKSYVYYDGTAWVCADAEPVPETIYEVGVLSAHDAGGSGNGFYATGLENDAPYSDWAAEYAPTSKECVQIVRNGETIYRNNTGAGAIIKLGGTGYYVKFDTWIDSTNYPLQAGDIIIIEGIFVGTGNYAEAEGVKIKIDKTYVVYDGTTFTFSATEPGNTTEVDCGMMSEHADGWDASAIYFALNESSVPVDEDMTYPYTGTVQLVSNGATSNVNVTMYKIADGEYYMELDGVELADGDYLVVEGAFTNGDNGYILNISKTYILVDGDALVYSETEPVLETEFAVTGLTNHANGWTADGIYISHDAHEAYYGSDWDVRYRPVSADVIKLVRGGETFNIGQPEGDTLVVYSNTNMYFETKAWTTQGDVLPFVDGDQIIIEGKFKHEASGNILVVEKTVIDIIDSNLYFNLVHAGNMANHSNGVSGEGVYATMAENAAPYDDWNIEYTPVTADAYYVIRNGEQINIGIPGRGTLVKYNATDYYLKINAWCTDNFAYTTDDIIVVDGFWKNEANNVMMKIEKTYLYYNGSAWVFATELPTIVDAGVMQTHEAGMSGNGIYFRTAANDAPFNSDWSLEYKQTSADNIKLIRGGETISIGIVDRPMFVRINECDHYLKLEAWTIGDYAPITTDDVLIIEGSFQYDNVTLKITKSYVYFDGVAWVCSAEAPVQKNIVDVVNLSSSSNGWTSNGFYFLAEANDAPFNTDWSLRYKPVSADAIKLINADGSETNVGNTGGETIVKYSETEYYVEGWTVGSANMVAGSTFVIDGLFYNEANDTYMDVEKTYITLNEGGTTTIISDAAKYINAGAMGAYTSNWFGDGIYFVLGSNIAPADAGWNVRYTPKAASNIKLVRGGETISIANTGAETIVKIADGQYWLSLESWWWSTYAPIQDGDQLIIEGEFSNSSNGYTLNIDKTYITFVSNADDNVVFSTAADTDFGEVLLPNSADTLTIGMWNGSYHVFNDTDLQRLQALGITKIMGINTLYIGNDTDGDGTISDAEVSSWLDRVYSYGISVIIDLRDWDGSTVPGYASHPGLIGFLMYDEPNASVFDDLADLKEKFDAVMPEGKLFYVNLFPECAADSSLVSGWNDLIGNDDYDEHYVSQFLAKLDIEVLSWDNYSLLSGNGIRTDYFHNFEVMAAKANENLPLWYTMLSAGHGTTSTTYATPTEGELRWQMAVAMTYGVQNIDHYTYVSHESDYSCMVEYDTWEPTDLYYDILTVDNEYLAWDNIFMAYDWVGVGTYSANSNNSMLTQLENSLNLSDYGVSVSASENLLIGVFDYNGENAYMVTNAGSAGSTTVGDGVNFSMNDTTVTLTLADADYKCVAVIDNGQISYVAVNADNTVTLNVQAYEGVFVIPVLN